MRFSSKILIRNISAIAVALAVAACDAGRLTNPPQQQNTSGDTGGAASIVLSHTNVDMAVGDIVQITATAYDENGNVIEGRDVSWSTLNSRAKVNRNGTVEGLQVGSDTIFASMDGNSARAGLRVFVGKVMVVVVSLSPRNVEVGGTSQATTRLYNQHGDEIEANVFWTSTNPAVASIEQDGSITAKAPGTTKIKAVSEGRVDTEDLTVVPAVAGVPVSVTVGSTTSTVYIGRQTQLTATVRDANGNVVPGATVTWTSSNPAVATVSPSGQVTGVSAGTASFTAACSGKTGTTSLSVQLSPINALSLALQPSVIVLGATPNLVEGAIVAPPVSQAVATAYDADGAILAGRTVTYTSSNTSVATVAADGMVMGLAAGAATITATSEGKTAAAAITVNPAPLAPVASITVVLSSPSLQVGASTQALATPLDAGGASLTGRSITWSSSNNAVATVSASGLVTAAGPGTASIRASSESKTGSAQVSVVQAVVLTSIEISPASATLNVGESRTYSALGRNNNGSTVSVSVTWSATGGNITQQGGYTAGQIAGQFLVIAACACGVSDTSALTILAPTPPPTLTAISVAPTTVSLVSGDSVQINASAWMSGAVLPVAASVVWSATGGVVNQSGKYIAGNTAGTFYVRATSSVDASRKDSAMVTITAGPVAPPPTSEPIAALTVTPKTASLQAGQAYNFVANGWLSGGSTPIVTPVEWTATGGTVDQTGQYVAGNTAGTFVVRARSTTITWRVDSAIVTITSTVAPPTVTSFILTPATAALLTLGTLQFQTASAWSDGASRSVAVSYSATGGSISAGGLYTAGSTAGTFRVIANCDCGRADTTVVTLTASPPATPTVTSFVLTPGTASLLTLGVQQFQTSAAWTDGASRSVGVSYSATGGSITSGGLFTAGLLSGAFRVIATCDCGRADTTNVTLTLPLTPPPTIPPPVVGPGNPLPSGSDRIILDTRAGGANSFQTANTKDEAEQRLKMPNSSGGLNVHNWGFTTNFDGNGTHALICQLPGYNGIIGDSGCGAHVVMPTGAKPTRLFVQWQHYMGRTATGGGIGALGAFDITNEYDLASNAGRKYLILCRPTVADPYGCGPRADHIWGGPAPVRVQTEGFYGIAIGEVSSIQKTCSFDPEQHIGEVITFTHYLQAESYAGARDGVVRYWYNGVLCGEGLNLRIGPEAIDRIQFPEVFRSPKFDMSEYFFNYLVWSPG